MLVIAGGIILAVLILWAFAALARPIFKILIYLIGCYVLIMAAGFLCWGLVAAHDYLAPRGRYGVLIGVLASVVIVAVTKSVFVAIRNRVYRKA